MNRIHVGDFGSTDNRRNIEVALRKLRGPHANGFICEAHWQGVAIRLAVDRNRPDPKLFAGANHPQRNFASIGNENLLEHGEIWPLALGRKRRHWPTAKRQMQTANRSSL